MGRTNEDVRLLTPNFSLTHFMVTGKVATELEVENAVICLVATDAGKASIVVAVTADLVGQKSAVDLVKIGSAARGGGGGGGRLDMAQAGGPDASKAAEAIKAVSAAL